MSADLPFLPGSVAILLKFLHSVNASWKYKALRMYLTRLIREVIKCTVSNVHKLGNGFSSVNRIYIVPFTVISLTVCPTDVLNFYI